MLCIIVYGLSNETMKLILLTKINCFNVILGVFEICYKHLDGFWYFGNYQIVKHEFLLYANPLDELTVR